MARTNVVKNLGELYAYAVTNPYLGNGLIKSLGVTTMHLDYDNLAVASFTVGEEVEGGDSGATGIIVYVYEIGTEGYLLLDSTDGTFVDDERIVGATSGTTADVDGTPATHIVESTRDAGDVFTDADDEVIVRAVRGVGGAANTVITVAKELAYDGAGANPPNVNETLTGVTSGATGIVVAVYDDGGAGWVTLNSVDEDPNPFQNNEKLTGSVSGVEFCDVDGTLQTRTATFSPGDQPDEAVQVVVEGPGLSTTSITGGAAGNMFEILRGIPTYDRNSDYILYCTAKTHEEGELTIPVRDKGQLQHRKKRADVERRLSLTALYVNSKTGLLALVDRDIILITERNDDRAGPVTEYHYYLGTRINELRMPEEAGGDDFSKVTIPARFERSYTLAG